MQEDYFIKFMKNHEFEAKKIREEMWETGEQDRLKSIFRFNSRFNTANGMPFELRIIVTEQKSKGYPKTLELIKNVEGSEAQFRRVYFEKIDTETDFCEFMQQTKRFIIGLRDIENINSEPEKFIKSKYFRYNYNMNTGEVSATFLECKNLSELKTFDLGIFLSGNGVSFSNFSIDYFVEFSQNPSFIKFISVNQSSIIEIIADKLFPPTKSKGEAIKQMVDSEKNLDDLIKKAKEFTENEDLVTSDFVAQMNGEDREATKKKQSGIHPSMRHKHYDI